MTGTKTQKKASTLPSKRIVICCDGTWCGPAAGTKTNTRILADSFASAGGTEINMYDQPEYGAFKCHIYYNEVTKTHVMYMPGIGLGTNFEGYLLNGSLALEFGKCCTTAYKYIVERFQPEENDTRIYMFGHSRGAFAARAVAAMIHNCGILDIGKAPVKNNLDALVEGVYDIYTNNNQDYLPDSDASRNFRIRLSHCSPGSDRLVKPPIEYLGLLDTVGALGVPKVNAGPGVAYERYATDVSFDVKHVWQGLAVHDRLTFFTPTHITRPTRDADDAAGTKKPRAQTLKGSSNSSPGAGDPLIVNDVGGFGRQDQGPGLTDPAGASNDDSTLRTLQSTTAPAAPYVSARGGAAGGVSGGSSSRPSSSAAAGGAQGHTLTEVWLPGAHYDVGRQKFVLFRQAAGWERVVSYLNKHFNRMGLNIDFNKEQADLALLATLKGLYNTSDDAKEMLCEANPVTIQGGREVLADKYKARTQPDLQPHGWLDAFTDSFATLLLKVAPHVPERLRPLLLVNPTASQDAYDTIVGGITKNGLPTTLFSLWLLPVDWALDMVVKNIVCTSTPIVLADRHIPLYTDATFVSTYGLSTDYVTGVGGVPFKSQSFNTYRVASGEQLDRNGQVIVE